MATLDVQTCSACGSRTKVTTTRPINGRLLRYRCCKRDGCEERFTTSEQRVGAHAPDGTISINLAEFAARNFLETIGLKPSA